MESDTPDFNVFHFSFLGDTLPDWEKEIELSDTELISCAEAQVNEAIETTTRFPKDDLYIRFFRGCFSYCLTLSKIFLSCFSKRS